MATISNTWYGAGIGLPTSYHERTDSSVPDELPICYDWHPYKGMFWGLEGEWAFFEWTDGVRPPVQMKFDHTVDHNLLI